MTMEPWTILGLAIGLGMDAFAVAAAIGLALGRLTFRPVFRLSWHFGFFQFLMPVLGWMAGQTVSRYITSYDHWVAFGLLVAVAGKMIYEAFEVESFSGKSDPTRGWSLLVLSVATSIDALAVGLSMAMLKVSVWIPSVIIGVAAAGMTLTGMYLGRRIGHRFGRKMHFVAAGVLVLIGIKILIEHLTN
jgi:manganese efflux pump family protein